jgi:glycosyltransferase involved in cell wall biosynthesis
MKILFVDQFSELGGAQLGLRDLLDETTRRGWEPTVMAPGDGPLIRACEQQGIPVCALPLSQYSNGHKTVRDLMHFGPDLGSCAVAIRRVAGRFRPDLIYVNGPRVLPAAILAAESGKVPVVFHANSYPGRTYARKIMQWCANRERVSVIAISHFVAKPFIEPVGRCRIRAIYNGVRDYGFIARPREESLRIGILGRISEEKGHLDFVEAARLMAPSRPGLRFVIFGEALFSGSFSKSSYDQLVRALAIGAPIEFRGWTDDVAGALHEIDILAVPSGPGEGATRVIMEAFSAGTPVVAYPSGGIPELITHGKTGLLTARRDYTALVDAIGALLDDPQLAERLSVQGRAEWQARFTIERWHREVCDFIEETVASARVPNGLTTTIESYCEPPALRSSRGVARGER